MKEINKAIIVLIICICACGNRTSKAPENLPINESALIDENIENEEVFSHCKNLSNENIGDENTIRNVSNSIQLKKVTFASTCSYYIASGKDSILINNIEQARILMMKKVFGAYDDYLSYSADADYWLHNFDKIKTNFISDDVKGWTLVKRNKEKECNVITNSSLGCKCEYKLYAEHYYQNTRIISITYYYVINYCGAHTGSGLITHTFDKNTGKEISFNQLVIDEGKLSSIAEKQFWKENKGNDISTSTKFKMANKFKFTEIGIRFYYDEYEIAAYAYGILEFTILYSDLVGIVNYLENF